MEFQKSHPGCDFGISKSLPVCDFGISKSHPGCDFGISKSHPVCVFGISNSLPVCDFGISKSHPVCYFGISKSHPVRPGRFRTQFYLTSLSGLSLWPCQCSPQRRCALAGVRDSLEARMTDDGARFEVGHFQEAVSPLSGWCQRVRQSSLRSTCSSRFRRLQAAGVRLPGPHLCLCGLRLLEGALPRSRRCCGAAEACGVLRGCGARRLHRQREPLLPGGASRRGRRPGGAAERRGVGFRGVVRRDRRRRGAAGTPTLSSWSLTTMSTSTLAAAFGRSSST